MSDKAKPDEANPAQANPAQATTAGRSLDESAVAAGGIAGAGTTALFSVAGAAIAPLLVGAGLTAAATAGVLMAAPVLIGVVAGALVGILVEHLTKKPKRQIHIDVPSGRPGSPPRSPNDLIREAQAKLGVDSINHINIAFCGQTGTGKSSLINRFLNLPDDHPDAAPTDTNECTRRIKCYSHPTIPHLKFWDFPGAGTDAHPAATYFIDKMLYAFDVILVISSDRFNEVSQQIAQGAAQFNRSIGFVRSKAEDAFKSVQRKNRGMSEQEIHDKLRRNIEGSFRENGLTGHRLFLVSAWNWADDQVNFGEEELVKFFDEAASKRH